MFTNYKKRFSTNDGNSMTGFEQVVTNGIPTYYVIDEGYYANQYDQNWNRQNWYYQSYYRLPNSPSYNLKYANGYFYISANKYFYKTDMNFKRIAQYYDLNTYSLIYYDSNSSLFYVTGDSHGVSVFDTNCYFKRYVTFESYTPSNSWSYFNGNLYGDSGTFNNGSSIVVSKVTGVLVAKYNTICSMGIYSITFDSFGYMAVGCGNGSIALYNSTNGKYLNLQLTPSSNYPRNTFVDPSGRFLALSATALDFYY